MTALGIGFGLAAAVANGYLCAHLGLLPRHQLRDQWLFKLLLGVPMGLALSGAIAFASLLVFGAISLVPDVLLLAGLAVVVRRRAAPIPSEAAAPKSTPGWLLGAWLATAAVVLPLFFAGVRYYTFGHWDAWDDWNLRALFFVRLPAQWWQGYFPFAPWTCPNYPPLYPAMVARLWSLGRGQPQAVPQILGAAFTLSAFATLIVRLRRLRGWGAALLGSLVLLGTPHFWFHGTSQTADIVVMGLLTALVAASFGGDDAAVLRASPVLIGLLMGLLALTKIEGGLIAAALITARWAWTRDLHNRRARWRDLRRLATGAALPLVLLLIFRAFYAGANVKTDYALAGFGEAWQRLTSAWRYAHVAEAWLWQLGHRGWSPWVPLVPLLAGYALVMGRVRGAARPLVIVGTAFGLTHLAYAATYVVFAEHLGRLVDGSLERLIYQWWPSLVLVLFVALRAPEPWPVRWKSRRLRPAVGILGAVVAVVLLAPPSHIWRQLSVDYHGRRAVTIRADMRPVIGAGLFSPQHGDRVAVQGDFSGWKSSAVTLVDTQGDGIFTGTLHYRGPPWRGIAYKLVIHHADGTLLWERDFGAGPRRNRSALPDTVHNITFEAPSPALPVAASPPSRR